MIELELLGVGADGETLVLTDSDGERYRVPITDELRASVRRDRPRIEAVAEQGRDLRPRDIQALLRGGATAEEIAASHSIDVAYVRRFESPVLDEIEYALRRARSCRIGSDPTSPVMGDLVIDRLAARGVDPTTLQWTANRTDGPWNICLTFVQGAAEHGAHWTFDPATNTLDAVDQEARWLTETSAAAPAASSIFTPLPTAPAPVLDDEDDLRAREALVDQLNALRGRRQDVVLDDVDDDLTLEEGPTLEAVTGTDPLDDDTPGDEEDVPVDTRGMPISQRVHHLTRARGQEESTGDEEAAQTESPTDEAPSPEPTTGEVDALPGLDSYAAPAAEAKDRRKGRRRSVPSWDEIVFGSRS